MLVVVAVSFGQDAVDPLVEALAGADTGARGTAATALRDSLLPPDELVPRIAPLLKHDDPAVRAVAVELVGDLAASAGTGVTGRKARRERRAGRLRTRESEAAVERALGWLASSQEPHGFWDGPKHGAMPGYDAGLTGLALLAFLGADCAGREGEPHAAEVARGLAALVTSQAGDGRLGRENEPRIATVHSVATLALADAWIQTRDPAYRDAVRKAVEFLARIRRPESAWGYDRGPDSHETGWAVLALRMAELGGVRFDPAILDHGLAHFGRMTDPEFGQVGYDEPGGFPATYAMVQQTSRFLGPMVVPVRGTRAGVTVDREAFPPERTQSIDALANVCRLVSAHGARKQDFVDKGERLCADRPPRWAPDTGDVDMTYWFFGSLFVSLRSSAAAPSARARVWFAHLHRALPPNQREDGSWDPVDAWGPAGGRVYATAMGALALEAPYLFAEGFADGPKLPPWAKEARALVIALRKDGDERVRKRADLALARIDRKERAAR